MRQYSKDHPSIRLRETLNDDCSNAETHYEGPFGIKTKLYVHISHPKLACLIGMFFFRKKLIWQSIIDGLKIVSLNLSVRRSPWSLSCRRDILTSQLMIKTILIQHLSRRRFETCLSDRSSAFSLVFYESEDSKLHCCI